MSKPHLKDYFTKEFIVFVCCNGFAAVVNVSTRMLFGLFTSYTISVVLAFLCGLVTAFVLSRIIVFKIKEGKIKNQFVKFFIVNLFGLLQTILASFLLRNVLFPAMSFTFHPDSIAHMVGVVIPVFTSFLGHKYLSFGKEDRRNA